MKKYLYLLLPPLLVLFQGAKDPVPKVPYGLMIEFIRDPEGVKIMDLNPEFTWIVPVQAVRQKAYRILVASSAEMLKRGRGDAWDSGRTDSDQSAEISLSGKPLLPGHRYFWKVMIWNINNKATAYSAVQSFTTGKPEGYQTTQDRFIKSVDKPVRLVMNPSGNYFADFGRDAFGTVKLDFNSSVDQTIKVHLGEKISAADIIDRNPGGSIRYQEASFILKKGENSLVLKLSPDVRNTGPAAIHLPDSIGVLTPFRYCEIENLAGEIRPGNLSRISYSTYFDDAESSFASSDTILNQIWNICKYSMKATSFAGIYIDGDRERIPYEGDAYINQLGHYSTDREFPMGRLTDEYFMKHPTWPTEWILHTVLLFYNDYLYTGNRESLEANYDGLKFKTLNSLAGPDGLVRSKNATDELMRNLGFSNVKERIRDIVDWPPAQKDTGWKLATAEGERDGYEMTEVNTVVNAFYYRNLVLMTRIAGILGKAEDSAYFRNEAMKTRQSINTMLLDPERGYYVDGLGSKHSSLHANMMALDFGLAPGNYVKRIISFIKSRGMACSVYGSQYLLEGLYKEGEADYAYSLLTATGDRGWWNMIRSGSTITMEAWDMKYKPNSDWNHAWGAAPANIIPAYLWGIRPASPGFARAVIRPQLSSLKYSTIKVPTIRGPITAEFRDTGKTKEYIISIPGNMECDFITPEGKTIKLNAGVNKIVM